MDEQNSANSSSNTQPGIEAKRRLIFGDFEFHPLDKKLLYRSSPCHLDPKMLDLLSLLIDARPNLVSKDELMNKLWPDSQVSDWSLARLISDTRKLIEDNGKSQSIIKTVRGKGFAFIAKTDEIIEAYDNISSSNNDEQTILPAKLPLSNNDNVTTKNTQLEKNQFDIKLVWISSILFLVATGLLIYFQPLTNPQSTAPKINHQTMAHKKTIMLEIQKNLNLTKTAFLSQVKRRNELAKSMLVNMPELKSKTWEQRFRIYYPHLSKDEKFLFEQIKVVTKGALYKGNTAILKTLNDHPEMYQELELFMALNSHLEIWLHKYKNVFLQRDDLPIVYVGVEDGVPFPSEIDNQVDEWIKQFTP